MKCSSVPALKDTQHHAMMITYTVLSCMPFCDTPQRPATQQLTLHKKTSMREGYGAPA